MTTRAEKADAERAALAALQAVANDPQSSAAARVAAARAMLEHLRPPGQKPASAPKAPAPPKRSPAELAEALRVVRSKQYPTG